MSHPHKHPHHASVLARDREISLSAKRYTQIFGTYKIIDDYLPQNGLRMRRSPMGFPLAVRGETWLDIGSALAGR